MQIGRRQQVPIAVLPAKDFSLHEDRLVVRDCCAHRQFHGEHCEYAMVKFIGHYSPLDSAYECQQPLRE